MKRINNKGFTLIELVLVITILGILAVMALPQFFSLTTSANDAARDGVVGAVRAGINVKYASALAANSAATYAGTTPLLDAAAGGEPTATGDAIFDLVLQQGVTDTAWNATTAGLEYTHTGGTALCTYTYAPATGLFTGDPPASCP